MASTNRKRASSRSVIEVPLEEMPIEDVWREYQLTRTEKIRNFLTERYRHVAVRTAERMHRKLPSEVDLDDVISVAVIGMMEAIDSYELDRSTKFETFCARRIHGAIVDELRAMDWVPRLVRIRARKVEQARRALHSKLGRPPTNDELRTRLDVDKATFEKIVRDSMPVMMGSLDRPIRQTDSSGEVREIDVIRDRRQDDPLRTVQKKDQTHLIIRDLSRAERLIVILYYHEDTDTCEYSLPRCARHSTRSSTSRTDHPLS